MYTSNFVKRSMSAGVFSLVVSTVCVSSPSSAQVINGSFETGAFPSFSTIGDTSIQTSAFGSGPTAGNFQALITNNGNLTSVPASELETFLGLAPGNLNSLGNGTTIEGSAIRQTFTANAGDVLTFDYNFLTQGPLPPDPNFNDFSFFTISNSTDSVLELADTSLATTPFPNPPTFDNQTGFQSRSFTIPTSGTFNLGFGVTDVEDGSIDSGLLVDNIVLQQLPVPEPIPEPASVLGLLTFGALGAIAMLKRKRGKYQK